MKRWYILLTAMMLLTGMGAFAQHTEDNRRSMSSLAALMESRKAYAEGSYHQADFYASLALRDTLTARQAAEIKISCMKKLVKTAADSTRYLVTLLQLHDVEPENSVFMKQLMDYFSDPGHEKEMAQFASDEVRKDPHNKMAWVLRGETLMRQSRYVEASEAFAQAVELDSAFVEAIYNIGVCHLSQAQTLTKGGRRLAGGEKQRHHDLLKRAQTRLLRAQQLDADRQRVDWAQALYQVSLLLGDKQQARKLRPLVK